MWQAEVVISHTEQQLELLVLPAFRELIGLAITVGIQMPNSAIATLDKESIDLLACQ